MQRDRLSVLVVVAALLAVGLVGAALVTTSGAQDPDGAADRSITVDATGSAAAPPDQAVVRVAATAEGESPGEVRSALAEGADALRSNLSAANVSRDDYETTEYRISEPRRPPEERDGPAYEGVHAFEVTLDDPDRAGVVIDAAAAANARIDTVEFTLSSDQRQDLRGDAIDAAMNDARTQAGAIADSGGLQVTDVVTVDASQQNYSPVRYEAAAATADDGGTSLDTGEVTVDYQVRVTYNATLG